MSGAFCRGGLEQVQDERKSTLLQLLRCRCVHRKISWRWMKAGERMRRWPSSIATTRKKRGGGREEKESKKKKKEKRGRKGKTDSKRGNERERQPGVGEGAFSDEIRSSWKERIWLPNSRKRGKGERAMAGNEDVQASKSVSISSFLFLIPSTQPLLAANGITRIPHFKRRFIPPSPP